MSCTVYTRRYLVYIYMGYYGILLCFLIAQLHDDKETYTNWGTAVVSLNHFIIGGVIANVSEKSMYDTTKDRYRKWYNVGADLFTFTAFVLSIIN